MIPMHEYPMPLFERLQQRNLNESKRAIQFPK